MSLTYECYIITIETNSESIKASERCVSSSNNFGLDTKIFNAYTPRHDPLKILKSKGINAELLSNTSSYKDAVAGCFLSHFMLWEKCIEINKPIIILEHDAVIISEIPSNILDGTGFNQLINLGKPAHGGFQIPEFTGVGLIQSYCRFKGTHAYAIKPTGALKLIHQAKKTRIYPADGFLHRKRFPFLEELYPWPVIATTKFSTIQKKINKFNKNTTNIQLDEYGKARE